MKSQSAYLVYLRIECVEVDEEVDASVCKSRHAAFVILSRINMVDSDSVRAQILHLFGVELALICIQQWVLFGQLVGNA